LGGSEGCFVPFMAEAGAVAVQCDEGVL